MPTDTETRLQDAIRDLLSETFDWAAEMDEDMRAVLAPHATDSILHFKVQTRVVWGAPRATPSS